MAYSWVVCTLLFFAWLSPNRGLSQQSRQDQERWQASVEALANQEYKKAETMLHAWTQDFPLDEKAWFNLAVAFERQKKHQEAMDAFEKVLQIKADFPGIYRYLGLMALRQGMHEAATRHFKQAVEQEPHRFEPWFYLGSLYLESRQMDSCEWALQKALAINKGTPSVWLEMARLKRRTGNMQAAARMLAQARSNAPAYLTELGHYFLEVNRLDSALVCFEKAFKQDPESPLHQLNYVAVLLQTGRHQEAEPLLDSLEQMPEYRLLAQLNRSAMCLAKSEAEKAKMTLAKILEKQPEQPAAWLNLGLAYEQTFDLDSACICWQKAYRLAAPKAEQYLKTRCDLP